MDNKDYKRAVKLAVLFGMISLASLMALTCYVTVGLKRLNNLIIVSNTELASKIPNVQNGKDGNNGYSPRKGIDYVDGNNGNDGRNGRDSQSTITVKEQPIITTITVPPTSEQVATAVSEYCEARNQCAGPAGTDGARGPAGRTIFTRINIETSLPECMYSGDLVWLPLAECE